MIYFQRVGIIDNLTRLPIYSFRYTVMVKPEGDVAVPHYRCGASFFHLMTRGGKWAEAVGFNLFKLFCSDRGRPLILRPLKAESDSEAAFRDSSELNTSPRYQHRQSGKAVSRHFPPRPCLLDDVPVRIYGTSIVFGKCCKLLVDYRPVAVAAGHGGLEVVRYYRHRNPAVKMKVGASHTPIGSCLDWDQTASQ